MDIFRRGGSENGHFPSRWFRKWNFSVISGALFHEISLASVASLCDASIPQCFLMLVQFKLADVREGGGSESGNFPPEPWHVAIHVPGDFGLSQQNRKSHIMKNIEIIS